MRLKIENQLVTASSLSESAAVSALSALIRADERATDDALVTGAGLLHEDPLAMCSVDALEAIALGWFTLHGDYPTIPVAIRAAA